MNEIDYKIESLQAEIAELVRTKEQGYEVVEVANSEEYCLKDDHEVIYGIDGELAGIVINQKIMKKYFASLWDAR